MAWFFGLGITGVVPLALSPVFDCPGLEPLGFHRGR